MKSIYLIESNDSFVIEEKISNIKKNYQNEEIELVKYDLSNINIEVLIEDLDTYNFFTNKKIIVGTNGDFKTANTEQNIKRFIKYLNNPSDTNILILVNAKFNEKEELGLLLKEKAEVIDTHININQLIKDQCTNYNIDNRTINYLITKCNNDNVKIFNEIDKLKLYKCDDKTITINDIDEIVIKSLDDNIFDLIDAIVKKDKKNSFRIYKELIEHNEEPIKIIITLANKFRLIYQVKILAKNKMTNEEIGKKLGVKEYPVKLARGLGFNYTESEILSYIDKLADMDYNIKIGNVYQNISFETFILNI